MTWRRPAVQICPNPLFDSLTVEQCVVLTDVFATVGYTEKDLHPELKRLLTLAFFKHSKKEVDCFENWPADSDTPTDRLFGGMVEELEPGS